MNYNVNNENERIIIGEVGENLAESCTIDYSAWVEEYGEGDLRIRAIREGDAEPYPVANVETADGVATWTYTAADAAVKGFGEVQVLYYVGDVLAKSRVWKTYTYRSLNTSSEEVPDPYADWLNAVERIGGQVEADAEAASASADSASASATLAAGSASEATESALSASRSASAASSSAGSAASSASAASQSATEASNYEYYSEQYMNEAKSAKFGAESARNEAENAKAAAQASATAAAQSAEQAQGTAESIEESADTIQKLLANQIHDTATGTIATYPDGAYMPMVSLVADIDPIQDTSGGAPSPSHICPISGWNSVDVTRTGKNLFDKDATDTDNGYVSGRYVRSTDGATVNLSTASVSEYIDVKGNTQYVVSPVSGSNPSVCFYDANKTFIGGVAYNGETAKSFTTPSNTKYLRFSITNANVDATQLEIGTTATSYELYQGQTYHTTLPQTVYGGTLDVVSGVLTVDRAMYEPTSVYAVSQNGSGKYYWIVTQSLTPLAPESNDGDLRSNLFKKESMVSEGNCYITGYGSYIVAVPVDQTLNTKALADAWMQENHPQFCYLLKEPQTITLTPTQIDSLLGRNNVWADSGDVTVEYIADTKLYIQKVIS